MITSHLTPRIVEGQIYKIRCRGDVDVVTVIVERTDGAYRSRQVPIVMFSHTWPVPPENVVSAIANELIDEIKEKPMTNFEDVRRRMVDLSATMKQSMAACSEVGTLHPMRDLYAGVAKLLDDITPYLDRFIRIVRAEDDGHCPQCGAKGQEPCLTWRGETYLDTTKHQPPDKPKSLQDLYREMQEKCQSPEYPQFLPKGESDLRSIARAIHELAAAIRNKVIR